MAAAWVVWDEDQRAWVGPSSSSYSNSLMRAGLFTEHDANFMTIKANLGRAAGFWRQWAFRDPLGRTV